MRSRPTAPSANLSEDEALRRCALRFDGRRFMRERGWRPERALGDYYATGAFAEDEVERLALFAALARTLLAWGSERAPRDTREWFALRALFPEVCRVMPPPAYRRAPYHQEWEREWRPRVERLAALVKHAHEHTVYREDALPPT